ncbi:MAG: indole-3-glycerol phosphate synthase TrpC [Fimbriimonadaceae bacterium]|nr:indole-3-glycerol phosphate synthase TrpC [Fimbriimonadaceae bacterium]QYK58774.1 MAG: indole-3-glycerol phosphate synthase TrpC [Fimbriimonadaceae bacterium]
MSKLREILEHKRRELPSLLANRPLTEVRARALDAGPCRGFARALAESPHPVALIAEVKKASPSRGVIRADLDPVVLAREYEAAGADCLSVLTDEPFFQGSADNLVNSREAVGIPVLRKDFTTDAYHVWEARAMGADAVLLIVNGLTRSELRDLRGLAEELGMDALVEAHTLEEAETALESGATLLGINNRDLENFETDLGASCAVIPKVDGRALVVSESAIEGPEAVERVRAAGARAVLIGTEFCRSEEPGRRVREVMGW